MMTMIRLGNAKADLSHFVCVSEFISLARVLRMKCSGFPYIRLGTERLKQTVCLIFKQD